VNVKKLAVVGCGTMGAGIAQVAAQHGLQVIAVERDAAAAQAAEKRIAASLDRLVRREKISAEDQAAALALLQPTSDLGAVAEADVVIEAIYEDVDQKKRVFAEIDRLAAPDALLASNTSTIPLVILAAVASRPERVIGLHFFNPVPAMKLVEVIRTPVAEPAVVEAGRQLAEELGKSPVVINDVPGFVGNLLVVPYLLDAIRAYERSVAEPQAIDDVIRLGFNHPMGPFALADLIGLDIVHDMAASMYEEYKDPKYFPPPLLKQYVRLGWLGRKTGRGFYTYER
jgi:3-hydroxybutyryl-CoA dehydrogenase